MTTPAHSVLPVTDVASIVEEKVVASVKVFWPATDWFPVSATLWESWVAREVDVPTPRRTPNSALVTLPNFCVIAVMEASLVDISPAFVATPSLFARMSVSFPLI